MAGDPCKAGEKDILWIYEKDELIHLNVKTDSRWRDFWRAAYPSVIPGYHQNKEHWNTIILDGSVPDKDIERMIGESYDLVTDSPTKRIYEAVKRIPKGHVATYRQVAKMAGNERCQEQLEMRFIRIQIQITFHVSVL